MGKSIPYHQVRTIGVSPNKERRHETESFLRQKVPEDPFVFHKTDVGALRVCVTGEWWITPVTLLNTQHGSSVLTERSFFFFFMNDVSLPPSLFLSL